MHQEAASIQARKSVMRIHMRAVRSAMTGPQRAAASSAICARLVSLNLTKLFNRIAVYLAQPEEANIDEFSTWLIAHGVPVAAPSTQGGAAAPFYTLRDVSSTTRCSTFGVREPVPYSCDESYRPPELDVIIAPGLAFDARGGRLGFGGGWYDRALQAGVLPIGVCFDCQLVDEVPREAHDIPMAAVVTEKRIIDVDNRLAAKLGGMSDSL